ncbi:MAG: SpoIVB peptidase S55 domain-containing protein [Acidobacteriota bacterium]
MSKRMVHHGRDLRACVGICLIGVLGALPAVASEDIPERPTVETMPFSEVRPGMVGTVRTVFEGDKVEEFQAKIVSVMRNYLGPDQDLILARLQGEHVEFTGVVAGMSGSPVYIDGRLVGALSYRLGSFMKEPIAGITPIDDMLAVGREGENGQARTGRLVRPAEDLSTDRALQPIEAPLVAAGIPRSVLEALAPDLERAGLSRAVAGAAWGGGAAGGATRGLEPGDPVAVELIRGDISLGATGTVTHVDGDRVYAFGHPVLTQGAIVFPMARAQVYLTLPSLQASTKLGRALDTVGTFTQSRLPAMTGVMGAGPEMIPVSVRVKSAGAAALTRRCEVVDHRQFTPLLVALVTFSSLVNSPEHAGEMTMALSGSATIKGHEAMKLDGLYTGFSVNNSAALALARQIQSLFTALYQNRFEMPRVESVDLEITSVEKGNLGFVEGVFPSRTQLRPGERVDFRVLIHPYQAAAYTRTLSYEIPEGTSSGTMVAYVGGADQLARLERNVFARQVTQMEDLDQLIDLINQLRTSDKLYMKVTRRNTGAVVQNRILPALPPSVVTTLGSNRATTGKVSPMAETTVYEEAIPLEHILAGGALIRLKIE